MYSVPIVPPDLRHEETVIQAINSLEYLNVTIANIFDRIDTRIDKNNAKIEDLKTRIESAGNKINSLVGINKAIKIFSPAKFPAAHVFRDIPQTFDDVKERLEENLKLNTNYYISSSQDPIGHKNIQEKLVFYHVRGNKEKSRLYKILDQNQGLGPIPSNVSSVNSLLVYNTAESVYEGSKGMDNMRKENNRGKHGIIYGENTGQKIDAAPRSISHRESSGKKLNQGLFYTPKLNDAPEINVPVDLPDLPGIADDVTFELTESEKIAPSLYIEDLPELPEPVIDKKDVPNKVIQDSENKTEIKEQSMFQPPPPPPPPFMLQENTGVTNVKTTIPPPPPPPPPPSQPSAPAAATATKNKPQTNSLPEITDVRSNLMEAIRKAGGVQGGKLRAAADVVKKNEAQTGNKASKSSGDLMADLHNKLSMRRKGISGAKESEDSIGGGNVINRLSALIPPPPPKQTKSSTTDASDEEDWAE